MAEMNPEVGTESVQPGMERRLDRLDQDLEIMDRHAGEMAAVEADVQGEMKRWDREYKDTRLHSVPRGRKHLR